MRDDFAVFICTHGRPDKQLTLNAILQCGYTGKWYLVVDNADKTIQQYIDNFGADKIIVFDKNYYINSGRYDNGDNKLHDKCILYAKRAVEDIAKECGFTYFIIADDDITKITIRCPQQNRLARIRITDLDAVLDAHIMLMENTDIVCLGFGNVTHYFGGIATFSDKNLSQRRLPYQLLLRSGAHEVNWLSWFAEDDVTEYQSSMLGNLWLVSLYVMYEIEPVGDTSVAGGMVDTYKQYDMFSLQFNAVKYCPRRISLCNHRINGKIVMRRHNEICFPKIISGRYRK